MATHRSLQEARLGEPPDELNQREILMPMLDRELDQLTEFLEVDMAHAVMLTEQGILSSDGGARLLQALSGLAADPSRLQVDPVFDSLLLQIERYLRVVVGDDLAGRLHTGRSRNDQGSTVDRICHRQGLLEVAEAFLALEESVLRLAEQNVGQLMPGYSHLQLAQPITFAHYLMRHAETFERDLQRVEACYTRVDQSPLGLAAMAGTSWPLDRYRVAELLGFDGVVRNGLDCGIFNSDHPAEVASILAIAACNVSRIATDLYVWSTAEFDLVEIPSGLSGTSSIMPQKKNPHALERIMAIGGASIGWPSSILGITRGASSSDLGMTFSEDHPREYVRLTVGAARLLAATLDGLSVRREHMASLARAGWATASNLADALVREEGLSFREAHEVVARLVREAIERGLAPGDVSAADVTRASGGLLTTVDQDTVQRALDADDFVMSRTTPGSPHPDDVGRHIAEARARHQDHHAWVASRQERIRSARSALAHRVAELAILS